MGKVFSCWRRPPTFAVRGLSFRIRLQLISSQTAFGTWPGTSSILAIRNLERLLNPQLGLCGCHPSIRWSSEMANRIASSPQWKAVVTSNIPQEGMTKPRRGSLHKRKHFNEHERRCATANTNYTRQLGVYTLFVWSQSAVWYAPNLI